MKPRILVVEDNLITAKDIANQIRLLGYQVTTCTSAEQALKALATERPDLAILDINLGGVIDGIQLASIIKTEYHVPFIFLTSYNDEKTLNRIINVSPLGYVAKPFNARDLNTCIELALYKSSRISDSLPTLQTFTKENLFVKNNRELERIPISAIDYIHADGRYTYIYAEEKKKISNTPLKTLLDELPSDVFCQCYRSYIINLTKVDSMSSTSVRIRAAEIPLGKNFREDILRKIRII